MRTICITLPENPERAEAAKQHFAERGLNNVEFFNGIHAEKFGLKCDHPYMVDRKPGDELFFMGYKPTGCFLSHYMLWSALTLCPDEHVLILEDDCNFDADWAIKFEQALQDAPPDFDWLFIGSCCTQGNSITHIKGNIYDVRYPMCTHAYVIAKKALPHILATNRDCYAPIDISLLFHSFNKMKVYTVLPRIANQFNTEIAV